MKYIICGYRKKTSDMRTVNNIYNAYQKEKSKCRPIHMCSLVCVGGP